MPVTSRVSTDGTSVMEKLDKNESVEHETLQYGENLTQ
jgi:hypothetical protein